MTDTAGPAPQTGEALSGLEKDDRGWSWAASQFAADAVVRRVSRLTGGLTSRVEALDIVAQGRVQRAVLRRYDPSRLRDWGDPSTISLESQALSRLPVAIGAPTLVASDQGGREAGMPAVLMRRLPGRMLLQPDDVDSWLRQMARRLAEIHSLSLAGFPAFTSPWGKVRDPGAGLSAPVWSQALKAVDMMAPAVPAVLAHGDFQQFNLLWRGQSLSGVVDWTSPGMGPAEIDTGHCRLNLAVLYSAGIAERFRLAYEAEVGRPIDRFWDLRRTLVDFMPGNWSFVQRQAGRRMRIDVAGIVDRVGELVALNLKAI